MAALFISFTISRHSWNSYSPYLTCIQIQCLQWPELCVSVEHTHACMCLKQCVPVTILGNPANDLPLSKHFSNTALHKECWGFYLWLICIFLSIIIQDKWHWPPCFQRSFACNSDSDHWHKQIKFWGCLENRPFALLWRQWVLALLNFHR